MNRLYRIVSHLGIRSLAILYYLVIGVLLLGAQAAYADRLLMWGFALDGYPVTEQKIKAMEKESGLRADIIVFFIQWPSPADVSQPGFPLESLQAIWDMGAIPCITWEPMYYRNGKETMIPYTQLTDGRYDRYIKGFAEKARAWGKPFLIRFAHEMNIKRYHWGTEENEYGPESSAIYKEMFQYVVASFRKTGAHNALWVFCPNSESVPNTSYNPSASWNILSNYYPGDEYVDILGMDGYNWGTTQTKERHGWDSRWKTFGEIFERPCMELRAVARLKPLIVFETASVDSGGSKKEWIYGAVKTSRRLGIQGIVWFQSNKEVDWRINSNGDRSYVSFIKPGSLLPHDWIKRFIKE